MLLSRWRNPKGMLLGKGVSFFTCSKIHWGNYLKLGHQVSLSAWSKNGIQLVNNINIGTNCWIGSKVNVLDGVAIGTGCIIAAGSVVTKSLPDNSNIGGIPAKIIKERNHVKQNNISNLLRRESL
jgi:acetyltransferase-like isoleucine patch superfamily enzyme